MKKAAAIFLATLMLIIAVLPMSAGAIVVTLNDGLALGPGNTRDINPEYNYAWLDKLYVRTDALAVTTASLTPHPTDYPYSHTYEDFVEECNRYIDLNSLDGTSVDNAYSALIEMVYYTVTATGMTDNFDKMCAVLTRNGIELPDTATKEDKMKIGIVYAVIEFNAIYALFDTPTNLPAGISLDAALAIILGAMTGVTVPSGVDSVSGLGVQAVKQYLQEFTYLPLSDNPTSDELFYFLKVAVITEEGESVSLTKYDKVTEAEKEYVDYKYFSVILSSAYDTEVSYEALYHASTSDNSLAVHRVVLEAMLDAKGVTYKETDSLEKLFKLACKNGYFALEKEFYSDVLCYSLEAAPSCEKIWFTPITIGDQLNGGNKAPLSVYLQGNEIAPGSTVAATLDTTKEQEVIYLEIDYKDGSRHENVIYEFTVKKNPALESSTNQSGALGQVQDYVNNIVPTDNEKASQVVDEVFSGIGAGIGNTDVSGYIDDILSTYGASANSQTTTTTDNDYLGQLLEGMYETDVNGNIVTTKTYTVTTEEETEENGGIIRQVTQTVVENPEIVAAPTSLIALGGLIGFMMNKKHKDSLRLSDENEEAEEE